MDTKSIAKDVQAYPINLTAISSNPETSEQLKIATKVPAEDASSLYDFAALDGLRVVACLSVICFHSLLYWGTLLEIDEGEMLLNKVPALRLASFGNAGVDIFLVLTGLWATWQLVPAMEAACVPKGSAAKTGKNSAWSTVKEYYRKRVVRVLPAYATALALVAFGVNHNKDAPAALQRNHDTVFEYCLESLPLNFVLMNNLIGFGGCGVHFWSLSVQLQFYLAFPLLLLWAAPDTTGFRKRVTQGAVAAFVFTAGLRWGAAHAAGVKLPLPPYAHPDLGPAGTDVAVRYYHTLYFTAPSRIGNLATGVILGLFMLNSKATAVLRRRSARFAAGLLCTAILVAFSVLVLNAKVYGQMKEQRLWNHPQAFAALAYHGSPLFCLAAAAVVLTIGLHTGPLSTLFSAILCSKLFKHLAKVTYDVYLVHMIALYWFEAFTVHKFGSEGTFAAAVAVNPVGAYGAILVVTCLGGYVVGLVHNKMHHMILKCRLDFSRVLRNVIKSRKAR
ncbi:hypothetical protein Ndes2437B_g06839 [Nannochloris sp. 'desiccata']